MTTPHYYLFDWDKDSFSPCDQCIHLVVRSVHRCMDELCKDWRWYFFLVFDRVFFASWFLIAWMLVLPTIPVCRNAPCFLGYSCPVYGILPHYLILFHCSCTCQLNCYTNYVVKMQVELLLLVRAHCVFYAILCKWNTHTHTHPGPMHLHDV